MAEPLRRKLNRATFPACCASAGSRLAMFRTRTVTSERTRMRLAIMAIAMRRSIMVPLSALTVSRPECARRLPLRSSEPRLRCSASLDHLVGLSQQRRRNCQAEGLGSLEVDHQLELRGLLNRKVTGLRTLQDLVDVIGGVAVHRGVQGAV